MTKKIKVRQVYLLKMEMTCMEGHESLTNEAMDKLLENMAKIVCEINADLTVRLYPVGIHPVYKLGFKDKTN